jgi:DNA-directed RNA polymerase specialized sigma24 family protein
MPEQDPNTIDWPRVYAEAVRIALSFTTRDAQDVVQEAMKLYFAGEALWAPGGKATLAEHLVCVGLTARSKQRRTERRRSRPSMLHKLASVFSLLPPTPEQQVAIAEDKQRKAGLLDKLERELATRDPQAHRILCLEHDGVHEVREQAAESGMPVEQVNNARKRIRRRALTLSRDDEES